MQYYSKIDTIFKRDLEKTKVIIPEFTSDLVKTLKDLKWKATEKIDGTNISIVINFSETGGHTSEIRGKSEASSIPAKLYGVLEQIANRTAWSTIFGRSDDVKTTWPQQVEVFGEGFGAGIQKAGAKYLSSCVGFVVFDIKVTSRTGTSIWLTREACEDIAKQAGLPIVPLMGYMTIAEACKFVKDSFKSKISQDKDLKAEGLVLEAPMGILDRQGKRILTKVKTCDFERYKTKTGQNFPLDWI